MDRGWKLVSPNDETSHLKLLRAELREDYKKHSSEIDSLSAELISLKEGIAKTLNEVVGENYWKYWKGLESIEASYQVYIESVSTTLHKWVREFEGLAPELEREYNLTTSYEQVRIERNSTNMIFNLQLDFQIFRGYLHQKRQLNQKKI